MQDHVILRELFDTALKAADPGSALLRHLPQQRHAGVTVIGAGKAAPAMARALSDNWQGRLDGMVVTPYGAACAAGRVRVVEARHPLPDANGLAAAEQMVRMLAGLTAQDLVFALISGGGSALLPYPAEGLTLEDEIALNAALLNSGAPIKAMNAIRKQVSQIKGGRLAASGPARVITYIVSDVPGDDPAQVASGPTLPDETGVSEALEYVSRYRIQLPEKIDAFLRRGGCPSPLPGESVFAGNETHVIASAAQSLAAAAGRGHEFGLNPVILSDAIEGEACEVGKVMAALAKSVASGSGFVQKPALLLSGGETTVTMRGGGKGGRNSEFLLSFALGIEGIDGISALAADTDGIDGAGGHAGALADGGTCARIANTGKDPAALLNDNNSLTAFDAVDGLLITGPTGTNVNDFRAVLIR
ncbi:MAG: glycerate kinase [Rhodobacteraceae bacterium]|nr:glycerate kinase [Paracoccaceae bacterium]